MFKLGRYRAKSLLLLPRANSRISNCRIHTSPWTRNEKYDPKAVERVDDEVDVCIVGAGPAGLSAAIRIKQLEREKGKEIRVVVLEKGSEVGAHILSGAVLEPRALYELLGDPSTYAEKYGSEPPLQQKATGSRMLYLADKLAIPMPHPPQMSNEGNYVISLSALTRWLAEVAESHYGVEIYPGFSAAGLLFSEEADSPNPWTKWEGKWGTNVTKIFKKAPLADKDAGKKVKRVLGVITGDVGVSRSGRMKGSFEPGMIFRSKVTLLAEGAHGSLSKLVLDNYDLRRESEGQTYGFGLKEVWRIAPEDGGEGTNGYNPGEVVHTLGFPLDAQTYGGGWLYHMDKGLVSLGLVVGADWKNPYRQPYRDLQKMKHHPYFQKMLTGSESFTPTRIAYGARILTEGGLQSIPLLHFPGGALIGCSAGFVNIAKIKGIHNAMKTGMLGGEGAIKALESADAAPEGTAVDMSSYTEAFTKSWVYEDLNEVRNLRPSFTTSLGMWGGIAYSGIDSLLLRGRGWWTFRHTEEAERRKYTSASPSFDSAHTEIASKHKPIDYPPFQPPLSTDLMTSVALTGTNHAEDQMVHLRVSTLNQFKEEWYGNKELNQSDNEVKEHVKINVAEYAGLLGHACPAGVYEYVTEEESNEKKLVINSQNCIHCKLCDVKVPTQDITWTVPEGGGGPKYSVT